MKKGLVTLLAFAASVAGVNHAAATAPVINTLPDITIGDAENNGASDNNYFVFTNAFPLDNNVSDLETTDKATLAWSFGEGDDQTSPVVAGTRWFNVNNKQSITVGKTATENEIAGITSVTKLPANTSNIRFNAGAPGIDYSYATFRDVVFTTGSALTQRYPTPGAPPSLANTATIKNQHAAGKLVTFFVSDGDKVASTTIVVKTVDNVSDLASGAGSFVTYTPSSNDFSTTQGNWLSTGVVSGSSATFVPGVPGTLQINIASVGAGKFTGWIQSNTGSLPYSAVGASKTARAKFYVFASGQTGSAANQIPSFRVRMAQRFAITSITDILHHASASPAIDAIAQELRPSKDSAKPSVYRVDLDPAEFAANTTANETIQAGLDTFALSTETQENGTLNITEVQVGTYNALSNAVAPIKTYNASDLATFGNSAGQVYATGLQVTRDTLAVTNYGLFAAGAYTSLAGFAVPSTANLALSANASTGVTINTAGNPDTNIGIVQVDFLNGAAEDANPALKARIEENSVYKVRFHATGTTAASVAPQYRFRARTVQFQFTQRLEIGEALSGSPENRTLAQYAPGVGSTNPDKLVGGENGGYYDLILVSPLNKQIRADADQTSVGTAQPLLAAQPGPGSATATSRRDLYPGFDIIDALGGNFGTTNPDPGNKGNLTIDKIEIRKYGLGE